VHPDDVRAQEVRAAVDRAVDVRFRCEVDDCVATAGCSRYPGRIDDVPAPEVVADSMQVREVAGIRQLVEDDDVVSRCDPALCEVRADETGSAGDENPHDKRLATVRCSG
jgi:hypothetical protein